MLFDDYIRLYPSITHLTFHPLMVLYFMYKSRLSSMSVLSQTLKFINIFKNMRLSMDCGSSLGIVETLITMVSFLTNFSNFFYNPPNSKEIVPLKS
jgi:hypothetical protein